MPKEQLCFRENGPCAPSSKNAKDKSNSNTLLAIRDLKHAVDSNRRGSSCSSEKDSGYSDGSDWQQTDIEVQRSTKSQLRLVEHAEAPQTGQSKVHGGRNTGNPAVMSTKLVHQPIYIIKPATTLKRSQLHVNNSMRISNHIVSPHMISPDQSNFVPASIHLSKPFKSQNLRVTGNKINNTYLPILKSYPRIAPHPIKKPPDKSLSNQESQYLSKRMCTERKTEDNSVTTGPSEEHHHNQPTVSNSVLLSTLSSRNSLSSSTFSIYSTNPGSPSISSLHTASSDHSDGGSQRKINSSPHHRRFLNTVELLRQSGLLDITLRTKELLRQSNSTEQEISQLRQHTELLCQAVSNPAHCLNGVTAWEHVCQAMTESGSYPILNMTRKSRKPLHPDPISQPQSISLGNITILQAAEGSCLSNTSSEQSQVIQDEKVEIRERSPGIVTMVSPDSSTG
ncbi:CLOCK-interacting pacemaker [Xiphophorus couchianus]|uniref:CLOCK-interacting pacemaker n=1 Tax=Xiphophorus couchianus TaxID=32473 RepID=UPI00101685DC|nr:CLOCK-interacting pacemaker-like [Xiphophorus couchianus]XP_027854641.1 CLOCK-interacting pacemaker-like [Xiphophorus couchianus]